MLSGKDGNDHVADQNLAADYFAEFPTTATMLGAQQRALPAAGCQHGCQDIIL